jgi:hypothetical protein
MVEIVNINPITVGRAISVSKSKPDCTPIRGKYKNNFDSNFEDERISAVDVKNSILFK